MTSTEIYSHFLQSLSDGELLLETSMRLERSRIPAPLWGLVDLCLVECKRRDADIPPRRMCASIRREHAIHLRMERTHVGGDSLVDSVGHLRREQAAGLLGGRSACERKGATMPVATESVEAKETKTREQWLAERRTGCGSSDAAAICGLSPWRTPWEVYLDKIGELPDVEPTPEMLWGLRLEPALAEAYEEKAGVMLSKPNMLRHAKHSWMIANIDRLTDSGRIVELKTANPSQAKHWGEEYTDQVPEQYLVQVQHQMAVADRDVADIAVLVGLADFRIYTVRRCDQLIFDLIDLEHRFWEQVERRQAPEPDFSKARTRDILKSIAPDRGLSIKIDDDEAILEATDFLNWQAKEKEAKVAKERVKAKLTWRMGEAFEAVLANGLTLERKTIHRRGYMVQPCSYQTFSVKE